MIKKTQFEWFKIRLIITLKLIVEIIKFLLKTKLSSNSNPTRLILHQIINNKSKIIYIFYKKLKKLDIYYPEKLMAQICLFIKSKEYINNNICYFFKIILN